jgi:hypothetical protein
MSATRGLCGGLLVLAMMAAGAAQAQDEQCPSGAVNTITGNYLGTSAATDPVTDPVTSPVADRCETCVVVRVQTGDGGEGGTWEQVGQVCNIWSDAKAHEIMYRIGRCGLIVPAFEEVGSFYGPSVALRAEALRMPPCSTR